MRPDEQRQLEETSTDVDAIAREMMVTSMPITAGRLEIEMTDVWRRVQGNLGEPTALLDPELANAVDGTRGLFGRFFANEPGIAWRAPSARNVDRLVRDALEARVRDRAQEEVAGGWRLRNLSLREMMSLGAVWRGTAAERIAGVRATQRMNTFMRGDYDQLGFDEQDDYREAIASALPSATVLSTDRWSAPLNADLARVTDPSLQNTMEMRLLRAYINATRARRALFTAEIAAIDAQTPPPAPPVAPTPIEHPDVVRYRAAIDAIQAIITKEEARLASRSRAAACSRAIKKLPFADRAQAQAQLDLDRMTALDTERRSEAESAALRRNYHRDFQPFIRSANVALCMAFNIPLTPLNPLGAGSITTLRAQIPPLSRLMNALPPTIPTAPPPPAIAPGTLTPTELLRRLVQRELQVRHATLPPQEIEIRSIVATGLLRERFLSDSNPTYVARQARQFTREGRNRDTYRDFDEFLNEAVFTETDFAPLRGKLGLGISVQDLSRLFSSGTSAGLGADQLNKLIKLIDIAWSGRTAGEGQLNLAQDVRPLRQRLYSALALIRARAVYDAARTATPPTTPSAADVLDTILAEDLAPDLSSPPTLNSRPQAVAAGLVPAALNWMERSLPLLITGWHALQQRFRRRPGPAPNPGAAPTVPPVVPPGAGVPRPPVTPPVAAPPRRRRRR